jgi:cell division protein FtsB
VERERSATARRRAHIGFRIAILALLGMFVFAITFPTMRLYLADQQELRALRADAATARAATDDINAELARWSDPAFVEAQARDRLSYVQPGDVAYRVVDPETAPQLEATPAAEPEPEVKRPVGDGGDTTGQTPWYTALWQSVQVAGAAPAAPEPAETAEAEPGTEAEDPGR